METKDPKQPLTVTRPGQLQRFVITVTRGDNSVEVLEYLFTSATEALHQVEHLSDEWHGIKLSVVPVAIDVSAVMHMPCASHAQSLFEDVEHAPRPAHAR